jgi:hypothetical protein
MTRLNLCTTRRRLKTATLGLAALPFICAAAPSEISFDYAVKACAKTVARTYPFFEAYVINDGNNDRVAWYGTDRADFMFSHCMNDAGHPLGSKK